MKLTDLHYTRCFPNSYTPVAAELFTDTTEEEDSAGWDHYNIAIRASRHVSGLVFPNPSQYINYLQLIREKPERFPALASTDGSIILLFKNKDWTYRDSNIRHPDFPGTTLVNIGLLPGPGSCVGNVVGQWLQEPKDIPEHSVAEPLKAAAVALRRAYQPFAGAIPISGFLSFTVPRKMPLMANGLLDHRSKTALAGEPKIGKSHLALEWALCLATGKPFLGQQVYTPARVLYVQFEITEQRFQERLLRAGAAHKLSSDTNIPLYITTLSGLRLNTDDGTKVLSSLIESCNPEVVFLDPLYKIHNLEENDNSSMQAELYDRIDEIMHDHAISVILVHHVNKNTAGRGWTRVRGASALIGWVDSLLLIEREEESSTAPIHCSALLRNGEEFTKMLGWRNGRFQDIEVEPSSSLSAANLVATSNVRNVRSRNA